MSNPSDEEPVLSTLNLDEQVLSVEFHPFTDIIAASLISGEINMYIYFFIYLFYFNSFNYSINKHEMLYKFNHHIESCRCLLFNIDGNSIFSASADKSISKIDISTGNIIYHFKDAHLNPIYCIQHYNDHLTATGDDEGVIKIWDTRSNMPSFKFDLDEHSDFVSSMLAVPEENILLATR